MRASRAQEPTEEQLQQRIKYMMRVLEDVGDRGADVVIKHRWRERADARDGFSRYHGVRQQLTGGDISRPTEDAALERSPYDHYASQRELLEALEKCYSAARQMENVLHRQLGPRKTPLSTERHCRNCDEQVPGLRNHVRPGARWECRACQDWRLEKGEPRPASAILKHEQTKRSRTKPCTAHNGKPAGQGVKNLAFE